MFGLFRFIMAFTSFIAIFDMLQKEKYICCFVSIVILMYSVYTLLKNMSLSHTPTATYGGSITYRPNKWKYKQHDREIEKKIVVDIAKKYKTSHNVVVDEKVKKKVEQKKSIEFDSKKLLPIKEIVTLELNKNNEKNKDSMDQIANAEQAFISESTILQNEKSDTPKSNVETDTSTKQVVVSENKEDNVVTSVIMIVNDEKLSQEKIGAYRAIIDTLKSKQISQSLIYTILQSIISIDLFSDSIVIYTSKPKLFNGEGLSQDDVIASMRKTLHDDNLDIEFVEVKDVSIAEYYMKNAF